METRSSSLVTQNRDIIAVVLGALAILAAPFVAMQFTSGMDWGAFDFLVLGTLLLGGSLGYIVATRTSTASRAIISIVIVAALLLAWVELAVGVFGTPLAGS